MFAPALAASTAQPAAMPQLEIKSGRLLSCAVQMQLWSVAPQGTWEMAWLRHLIWWVGCLG
jgi:hypothetical protein